ncbi:MAG TPA: DUF3658 domain-containing protein [Thermoclostridium sp.]|nr:DUF3658 domain-containing protein [Thermoclostridium sp.]
MLEVVFNQNTKAVMKMAKEYDAKGMFTGYNGRKPSRAELSRGQAIGGNAKDVVCIGFALDIGDISKEYTEASRNSVFTQMWGRFGFTDKEREEFFQNQRQDLEKLMTTAKEGTPIRIWESGYPSTVCGFYFVCHLLRDINCDLRVISLPDYVKLSDNQIAFYYDWGEMHPGKLYEFLSLEKNLSQSEKQVYSSFWCELVKENAPLRATVNGKLISVSNNFYDHLIVNNIPDGDFLMARLIGEIMGKYQLGVSDSWYALRIDKMIEANKLLVVAEKDKSHPYSKILRKVESE